jgi:hypothetical protein
MNQSQKFGPIDRYTGRPACAYPKREPDVMAYVNHFSRALGLKPTPTLFGMKEVKV